MVSNLVLSEVDISPATEVVASLYVVSVELIVVPEIVILEPAVKNAVVPALSSQNKMRSALGSDKLSSPR